MKVEGEDDGWSGGEERDLIVVGERWRGGAWGCNTTHTAHTRRAQLPSPPPPSSSPPHTATGRLHQLVVPPLIWNWSMSRMFANPTRRDISVTLCRQVLQEKSKSLVEGGFFFVQDPQRVYFHLLQQPFYFVVVFQVLWLADEIITERAVADDIPLHFWKISPKTHLIDVVRSQCGFYWHWSALR